MTRNLSAKEYQSNVYEFQTGSAAVCRLTEWDEFALANRPVGLLEAYSNSFR